MDAEREAFPGETATVHQSLNEILLFWPGVPFQFAVAVGVSTLLVMLLLASLGYAFLIVRILGVGCAVYLVIYVLVKDDPQRFLILLRYLVYPDYLPPEQLARWLPWEDPLDPEVSMISTTDDAVMGVLRLEPKDLQSLEPAERGRISEWINMAFKRLPEGWVCWVHGQRREVPAYANAVWPDPVSAELDAAQRAILTAPGARWWTDVYLTVRYKPPSRTMAWLESWFYTRGDDPERTALEQQMDTFRAGVALLIDQLTPACHEPPTRLCGAALKTYLHGFISVDAHPVECTEEDTSLSSQLADCGLWTGIAPILGTAHRQEHLRILTLTADVPPKTRALLWGRWYETDFASDWMQKLVPVARSEVETLTTNKSLNFHSTRKGGKMMLYDKLRHEDSDTDLRDTHSEKLWKDAIDAKDVILSDESSLTHQTLTFLVRHPDAVQAQGHMSTLQSLLQSCGTVVRAEGAGTVDAWFAMMPGQMQLRWLPVSHARDLKFTTANAAHLGCFFRPYAGDATIPHLGTAALSQGTTMGCNPFGRSPFVGDLGLCKHIGPKGSGKSTALCWDGVQWGKAEGSNLFTCDVDRASRCMTLCLGGTFHDVLEDGLGIQLLSWVDRSDKFPWLLEWLLNRVWEWEDIPKNPDVYEYLEGGLKELRDTPDAPRRMYKLLDILTLHANKFSALANKGDARSTQLALMAPKVRAAIRRFAWGSTYGHILDAPTATFHLGRVHTVELGRIIRMPSIHPGVLEALFEHVRDSCHGQPVRGHFDECSYYFNSETWVKILLDLIPWMRKNNFSAGFAAQSISQFVATKIAGLLIESCEVDYYYPNPSATAPKVAELYRSLNLSDTVIEMIARGTPKDEVVQVKKPEGKRVPGGSQLVSLRLPKIAQDVCGSSSPQDHQEMDDLLDRYGAEEFPFRFLDARGHHDAAKRVAYALAHHTFDAPLQPVLDLVAPATR